LEFTGQFGMRCKHPSKADEGPHNLDIHLNGTPTFQYARQHRYPLFRKGIRWIPPPSPVT
jgi:hypothetical protein